MTFINIDSLSGLHYTLITAFGLGLSILAYHYRHHEHVVIQQDLRQMGPALFVIIQLFNTSNLSLFKAMMLAEIGYFAYSTIMAWLPIKNPLKPLYTLLFILSSAVISILTYFIPFTANGFEGISLRLLIVIQILAIGLDALTVFIKKRTTGSEEEYGAFIFNALGSMILYLFFTETSLALMFIFRLAFYLALLHGLSKTINGFQEAERLRLSAIQKDFDDAVRKEVNHRLFYMELSKERMALIAKTDDLTGALNKKAMLDTLDRMIDDKKVTTFSILMFDIDKFKTINDTLGHITGDACLKKLSVIARESIRDRDHLCRYGGDEFVIILPDADNATATTVAERFRRNIERTQDPHFTVSIGIATYPEDGADRKALVLHADAGLYESKEHGRNRVSYAKKNLQ